MGADPKGSGCNLQRTEEARGERRVGREGDGENLGEWETEEGAREVLRRGGRIGILRAT